MNAELELLEGPPAPRTTLLRVRGRLDARSAPLLLSRCKNARGPGRNLVLNLSGVTFMASSGLGALLALVEEFRQTQGSVRLAESSQAVDSVVRLLNLHQFLALDETEEASLKALEG